MKIIKLNNGDETSGRFTNNFDESIVLEPNSEIALLNCSINVKTKNIVVTPINKTFKFKLSHAPTEPEYTVTLDEGVFTWDEFRDNLLRAMNKQLLWSLDPVYQYSRGFQWKISKSVDNKVAITFDRCDEDGYQMNTLVRMANISETGGVYKKDSGLVGRYDAYVQTNKYFINGCGEFLCGIGTPNSGTPEFLNIGFIIGLINAEKNLDPDEDRDISVFDYAIMVDQNTAGTDLVIYYKRYDPLSDSFPMIETNIRPRNNWTLSLTLTNGNIKFGVNNSAGAQMMDEDFEWTKENYKQHYYCAIAIKYEAPNPGIESSLSGVRYHSDPYHTTATRDTPENYNYNGEKSYNGIENELEIIGAIKRTVVDLIFENEGIKQLLGFINNIVSSPTITRYTFKSDKNLEEILLPDNVKIELENVDLEGYDSYTKGHRNILACVPNITYKPDSTDIIYQTDYPIFLNLRNTQRMILNSLKMSILNYKNDFIKVEENETDLTLLVK